MPGSARTRARTNVHDPRSPNRPDTFYRRHRRGVTVTGLVLGAVLFFFAGAGVTTAVALTKLQGVMGGMMNGRPGGAIPGAGGQQGGQLPGAGGQPGGMMPGLGGPGVGSGSSGDAAEADAWAKQQDLPAGLPAELVIQLRQQFPNGIPKQVKDQINAQLDAASGG